MIELTEDQLRALAEPHAGPPQVLNPQTQEAFVLLSVEEYQRLAAAYDDSPWSKQELEALAWETVTATKHSALGIWKDRSDLPDDSVDASRVLRQRMICRSDEPLK